MGLLSNTVRTDRFEIRAAYPAEVVAQRARDVGATGMSSYFSFGALPVRGSASSRRIKLVKRSFVNNSVRPYLFADIDQVGGPARLHCQIRPIRGVLVFMTMWLAVCVVVSIAWMSVGESAARFVPVVFLLLAVALLKIAAVTARGERDLLRRTIVGVAGAEPTPSITLDLP